MKQACSVGTYTCGPGLTHVGPLLTHVGPVLTLTYTLYMYGRYSSVSSVHAYRTSILSMYMQGEKENVLTCLYVVVCSSLLLSRGDYVARVFYCFLGRVSCDSGV